MMTNDSPEQTTAERHPDIEIYIKATPMEAAETWLQTRFGNLTSGPKSKQGSHYQVELKGNRIEILIIEKAAGNFTSLWFDSALTPWASDIDCAREAMHHFQREVRCIASGWQDGDEPDEWWSISPEGEGKILWQG